MIPVAGGGAMRPAATVGASSPEVFEQDRELMVLKLDRQEYGIPFERVRGIHPYQQPTRIEGTAPWALGLVLLRGELIPVLDVRGVLGLASGGYLDEYAVMVVCEDRGRRVGLVVDHVSDMLRIPIDAPVPEAAPAGRSFVTGVRPHGPRNIYLLDVPMLLAQADGRRGRS